MSDVLAAVCRPTEYMLENISGPNHDEYLYENTKHRERRMDGKKGEAYLCGYVDKGGCPHGTILRMKNAAIGGHHPGGDAVYTCSGGDDNYYWKVAIIEDDCLMSDTIQAEYNQDMRLYKLGDRYCKKMSSIQGEIFLDNARKFSESLNRKLQDQDIQLDIDLSGFSSNMTGNQLFQRINLEIQNQNFTQEQVDFIKQQIKDALDEANIRIDDLDTQIAGLNWKIVQLNAQVVYTKLMAQANQTRISGLESQLRGMQDKIDNSMTAEQVMEMIVNQLNVRQFSETEIATIQQMLQSVANQLGFVDAQILSSINRLSERVDNLEDATQKLQEEDLKLKRYITELKTLTGEHSSELSSIWNRLNNITSSEEFVREVSEIIKSSYATDEFKVAVAELINENADLKIQFENMNIDMNMLKSNVEDLNQWTDDYEKVIDYLVKNDSYQNNDIGKIWAELWKVKDKIKTEQEFIRDVEFLISQANLSDAGVQQVKDEIKRALGELDYVSSYALESLEDRILEIKIRQNWTEAELLALRRDFGDLEGRFAAMNKNLDNVTGIVNWLMEMQGDTDKDLKKVWERLNGMKNEILTSGDFVNAVENILSQENLNPMQIKEVKKLINQAISENGLVGSVQWKQVTDRLQDLEIRVGFVENRVDDLELKTNGMISEISALRGLSAEQKSVLEELKGKIRNYQTPEQVIEWILQNQNIFSEYQLGQIDAIVKKYVDEKFDLIEQRLDKKDKQDKAEKNIISAMSVLNAFAAGQDASVWRNADGKFNTARLVSDATAGVILGTAGGLISNKLIKKNQVKKGFEGIGCYVGGQAVAEFGDEFTVGIM